MRHFRARRLIPFLLEGELGVPLALRVREHVDVCDVCRNELAAFRRSETLLRQLPVALALGSLDLGGERRLRRLSRWSRPVVVPAVFRPRLSHAIAAAAPLAAAVGVALAVLFGGQGPGAENNPPEAFNFVLAGSFSNRARGPGGALPPRTFSTETSGLNDPGRELYLLPVGVR